MNFETWVYGVFSLVIAGFGIDHLRLRAEVSAAKVDLANLRTFVAENYIRAHELDKVYIEIEKIATQLDEAVKILHELKGQNSRG